MQVDYPKMAVALGVRENVLRKTLLSVSRASGHQVAFETLCKALKEGFEKTFQVQLRVPGPDEARPLFSTMRFL